MDINLLPKSIPIFPLNGALLLPGGNLPLNIFEPRYLSMVDYAMKNEKMIGMIQEKESKKTNNLYTIGCLGKITQFNEIEENKYFINLSGIIRFKLVQEIQTLEKFRKLEVDYSIFTNDTTNIFNDIGNRNDFLLAVKNYLQKNDIYANWDTLQNVNQTLLITTLASICPFSNAEKQMILESSNMDNIPKIMLKLFDMNKENLNPKSIN
tara:strand:- start:1627 stop:2253 length:627 start_codon:yes stop_codon:yes gene_type:complete